MLRIPLLRGGEPYTSLSTVQVADLRTGEPVVQVSHANAGLVAKDLRRQHAAKPLDGLTTAELIGICATAARLFTDVEATYTYEGTNEINLLIAGRELTGIGAFA